MLIEDFDYTLPDELIAQRPLPQRDASKLLHVERATGLIHHRKFPDLVDLLNPGDLLVVNDTRVIRARLLGSKVGTGGKVELLLVRRDPDAPADAPGPQWLCLGQASKGLKPGAQLVFDEGLEAFVLSDQTGGEYRIRFNKDPQNIGELPLPPYIARKPDETDAERYQTVFAKNAGSVAAPTAGLHFTPELLAALTAKGVRRAAVTLEVGPGTFLPVRDSDIEGHRMHSERCILPAVTSAAMQTAKRVVAVGTTVVRTLETFAAAGIRAGELDTRLFIKPGFEFKAVDAMVTNFHLPKSTLLMLVSAFLGREKTMAAYAEAVANRYRFFSYGDAMFIG